MHTGVDFLPGKAVRQSNADAQAEGMKMHDKRLLHLLWKCLWGPHTDSPALPCHGILPADCRQSSGLRALLRRRLTVGVHCLALVFALGHCLPGRCADILALQSMGPTR